MKGRIRNGLPTMPCTVAQSCRLVVVMDVKRDQVRLIKVSNQRRNRFRTSETPAIGLAEIRLSLALKAEADLACLGLEAGINLIHGLPP